MRAIAVSIVAALAGCQVGPRATIDGDSVTASGASNTLRQTAGEWTSNLQGLGPTAVVATADGLEQLGSGPHRTLTLALADAVVTLTDPLDGSLKGLRLTFPDGTVIELAELVSQPSTTIAAADAQVLGTLEAQSLITSEQAATARAAIAAGQSLAEALAAAGIRLIAP